MQSKRLSPKRIFCFFLLLLVIYIIETSAGINIKIFGFHMDLMPAVVASVALCGGSEEGAVIGMLTGILYDLSSVNVEGLYPAYYMLFAILAGYIGAKYLKKTVSAAVILTIGAMAAEDGIKALASLVFLKKSSSLLLLKNICGEILITAVLSPLIFFIVSRMDEKIKAEER